MMKQLNRPIYLAAMLCGLLGLSALTGCKSSSSEGVEDAPRASSTSSTSSTSERGDEKAAGSIAHAMPLPAEADDPTVKIATFAAGCFWCIQPPFDKTAGVLKTIVGYTGGGEKSPTYEQVSAGKTGHAESIRVYYRPTQVSYDELLTVFWHNINPTQKNGQFVDIGRQYRSAIFYHSDEQKRLAEASKKKLGESGRFDEPIVTEIVPAGDFWKAEAYHQEFYKKSPARYHQYHDGSGRDEFIEKNWGP